ncbi:MAG TPA: MMPL family transporter [Rhodothermales bacterium]|nr:MMPL family transporter [Rhodothermales bacterium]
MRPVFELLQERISLFFTVFVVASIGVCWYLVEGGIRFDYNIEAFLPDEDPAIEEYKEFAERYAPDDAVVMVGFKSDSLFTAPVLDALDEMTRAFERIPQVDRVSSLTNFERVVVTDDLVERRTLIDTATDSLDARSTVLGDDLAVDYLVDSTGSVTALYVHISSEEKGYRVRREVIEGIRAVTETFGDRFDFRYSGIPYLRNAYVDAIRGEAMRYFGLSSLVILVALVWLFRGLRGVVIPLVIVYLGVVWTIALMMVMGSSIDVLSSTISAMILAVGVADSVHLLARYYDSMALGLEKREGVRDMLVRLGAATLLTSVTTALGFASLMTSNIVPVRRFGVYTAAGVLMTFFISIVVLTAVLTWMPKPRAQSSQRLSGPFRALMVRVDRIAASHSGAVLLAGAVFLLIAVVGATKVRVNAYVNDDLGPSTTLYQDQQFFEKNLVAPFPLEIIVRGGPNAMHDPANLKSIEHLQSYLRSQPAVGRSLSIVDLIKDVDQSLNPDATGAVPEQSDLISQYFLLLDLAGSVEAGQLISQDHSEARVASLVADIGSARLNPLLADIDSVMQSTFGEDLSYTKTGTIVLASRVSEHIVDSLLISTALAFLFVSAIMGFLYRSPILIVISLIPNVLPLIAVAGFMGFVGIELKPATAVIFSISFGVAVDDTIHMLARLRQELKAGQPMNQAIHRSVLGTGKAILITSIILIGGFSILMTSQFQSSVFMGGLISLTVAVALLGDIFVLPALLYRWSTYCDRRGVYPFA